jgi:transposase
MQEEQRRAAKGQLIALMQAGHPWHEAAAMAGMHIGRSAAYQLLRNVRLRGEAALQDGRHGHPAKLRPPVREFLETTCREAPHTPIHVVQGVFRSSGTISNVTHVRWLTKRLPSVFTDVFFPSDKIEYLHPFYPSTADNPLFQ